MSGVQLDQALADYKITDTIEATNIQVDLYQR